MTKSLRERFGRPLRLALIGGGPGSWIGRMHQTAAELDGCWRVVGGVFSSDPARSREAGEALGIERRRSYGTPAELLATERNRPDGVDAVAIMTPNDRHYPDAVAALDAGFDVICDKPVARDFREACDLVERVRAKDRLFAITYGYSAYPMTRYAREVVRDGTLGALRLVQVEYIQSGLATRLEDAPPSNRLKWVLDPGRSGLALVMSAIGCHAQHLACFVAGRHATRVCADVEALLPNRRVIDYVSALFELEGGTRGTFTVTQAAAGAENEIRLRIYGEKGMLDWSHREASYVRVALQGEPVRVIGRGDAFLSAEVLAAGRTPRGHPEGLREAFANIYREMAEERIARALGVAVSPAAYPRIEDGAHSMAFIEACLASRERRGWVEVARSA
ncbi:MAG TPA: Gfo/Idh/MocA family oxidoreductase [Casimicrobiaceae bacterium]|nr:Gfo/Idh/MocA family oxidoreductase [Casimicrobiaceae bacterium]